METTQVVQTFPHEMFRRPCSPPRWDRCPRPWRNETIIPLHPQGDQFLLTSDPIDGTTIAVTYESLKQTTLPLRMADQMQADIRTGVWTDLLPGYRALAERYGTSSKTAISALKILEQRGLIEPAAQGSRRRVHKGGSISLSPQDAARGTLLILYASDVPVPAQAWAVLLNYRDCWSNNGGKVEIAQVNFARYKQPTRFLSSIIEKHRASALLLQWAPRAWVEAAVASQLPVYFSGGEWHTIEGPGDAASLQNETDRILAELRTLGHERILFPMEAHLPVFRKNVMLAFRKVLGTNVHESSIEEMCPIFRESVPAVWKSYWAGAFSRINPTAVVLSNDSHLLSLYGFCAERGINIPKDLSVVHVGYNDRLEWCNPPPFQMRFPLQKSAAHFRRWIHSGFHPSPKKFLPLEIVPGESVAKPPVVQRRSP